MNTTDLKYFLKNYKIMNIVGFEPFFNKNSEILILGSFPSVKSRAEGFYYGNKQNRFWRTLFFIFNENYNSNLSIDDKKEFLTKHKIALWDMVFECEIQGSMDKDIKNYKIADLDKIFKNCQIKKIGLNGKLSFKLFLENYFDTDIMSEYLPSTSPANGRFNAEIWRNFLSD